MSRERRERRGKRGESGCVVGKYGVGGEKKMKKNGKEEEEIK